MTDDTARIVANLRSYADGIKAYAPPSSTVVRHMLRDAADEIERLAEEVEVLVSVLQKVSPVVMENISHLFLTDEQDLILRRALGRDE